MTEEQPSSLPSRREEFAALINTDMEITIGHSKPPQFLKSIDDLVSFSAAVVAFKRQYDDLQNHMDYIDSQLKSNGIDITDSSSFHSASPLLSSPRNDASVVTTVIVDQSPPEPSESKKSEVQRLCEVMCSKGLRRYINTNVSDRAKLIEELPAALKHAKEPAKFVLECIGKFYLQGRKAFSKDSPMIPARQVSLLILESFLLMSEVCEEKKLKIMIGSSVKDEAETAAIAWRRRLVVEGGLATAEQMDARGLLLLIASFGVPSNFRNMDLLDLIRKSGSAEIAAALKRSPFLVPKISGIVESSIKRGMHIEALELVYAFGMEDRFPASSLLTAFLRKSEESFERAKKKANSPAAFKEANEKHLAALLSVMQCLEAHKLDPAKEVPGWQIKEEMVKLKKDTLQLKKEMKEKARSVSLIEEEVLAKRLYNQQMKRPRLSAMEMPPVASSSYSPIYRDRSFPSHRDEDRDEISALVSSYLGPSSAFPHRSSLRRSPEYMIPPSGLGRNVSAYEHLPPNSYSPVPGQRPPRLYSPPIDGQQQIPFGLQRVYRHSPSVERYLGLYDRNSPHRNSSLDNIGGM
ncbi:frigida [Arabis alpina]|uniref:FRIGIDA-like protein n=1 Tax=Arabis alpina TaxID=50452 RepID=A0A087H3Q1_ARAAL|nr:frigida [Arabis alpina]